MRQHTQTLQKQISLFTNQELTSLQVGFHASHFQLPDSERVHRTNAIYGRRCLEQYAKLNRHSSWEKMLPELLIGTGVWCSNRCRLTLSMKGTRYKRIYFLLRAWVPRMPGIESGLLPTVTAMMPGDVDMEKLDLRRAKCKLQKKNGNGFGPNLNELAKKGLLPTPTTSLGGANHKSGCVRREHGVNLIGTIKSLMPTPIVSDWKGSKIKRKGKSQLSETIGASSQLNPLFVMDMMGFPTDWTVLPFLNGEGKV